MKSNLESLGRLRLEGILLLVVLFGIGALTGMAFERARRAQPPPAHPAPHEPMLPPRLHAELGLTAEQEERVQAILESHRPRTDAVLERFLPRLRAVADSIRADVRAVLTAEQQAVFDQWQPPLQQPGDGNHVRPGRPRPGGFPGPGGPPPPAGRLPGSDGPRPGSGPPPRGEPRGPAPGE